MSIGQSSDPKGGDRNRLGKPLGSENFSILIAPRAATREATEAVAQRVEQRPPDGQTLVLVQFNRALHLGHETQAVSGRVIQFAPPSTIR